MFGTGAEIGIIPRSIALILSTVEAEARLFFFPLWPCTVTYIYAYYVDVSRRMAGSTSLRRRSSRFTRSTSGIFCTAKRTGKPSSTESFRFLPVSQTLASNPTRFLTVHDSEGRDLSAGRQRPARRFGPGLSACSHAAGRAPDDGDRRGQQDHRSNGHEREIVQEVGSRAHRPNTRTHERAHTNTRTHARTHTRTRTHKQTNKHTHTAECTGLDSSQ